MTSSRLSSPDEALKILKANAKKLGCEYVPVQKSLNRVLAEDVTSQINIPHFEKAAMDGYAVRSKDTKGAAQDNPPTLKVVETVYAGQIPKKKVASGTCVGIATGAVMPEGADAVVMVEYTKCEGFLVQILRPACRKEHVVAVGSDIEKGQTVLKKNLVLKPRHTAVLSSLGLTRVKVVRKPVVAVFPPATNSSQQEKSSQREESTKSTTEPCLTP